MLGSGQFGTPWERMHWLNLRMPFSWARVAVPVWPDWPLFASRCSQALWAVWN